MLNLHSEWIDHLTPLKKLFSDTLQCTFISILCGEIRQPEEFRVGNTTWTFCVSVHDFLRGGTESGLLWFIRLPFFNREEAVFSRAISNFLSAHCCGRRTRWKQRLMRAVTKCFRQRTKARWRQYVSVAHTYMHPSLHCCVLLKILTEWNLPKPRLFTNSKFPCYLLPADLSPTLRILPLQPSQVSALCFPFLVEVLSSLGRLLKDGGCIISTKLSTKARRTQINKIANLSERNFFL